MLREESRHGDSKTTLENRCRLIKRYYFASLSRAVYILKGQSSQAISWPDKRGKKAYTLASHARTKEGDSELIPPDAIVFECFYNVRPKKNRSFFRIVAKIKRECIFLRIIAVVITSNQSYEAS